MQLKTKTIEDAIAIAANAHKGQKDKAGAAYILHPLRLMMKMETEAEMVVAVLHDVVEDSDAWTVEKLKVEGFSDEVLDAVESVTKQKGASYEDFISRASENPIGLRVKIADLEDNLNTFRLDDLGQKDLDRLAKYHRSWRRLACVDEGKALEMLPGRSLGKVPIDI